MEGWAEPGAGLETVAEHLQEFLYPAADRPQARKRQLILEAATELFVAYGYRKTTIEDVAGAAGIAKGTLYLYYRNKAELFLHAIALQKLQYLEEMRPVFDPQRSAEARLRALIVLSVVLSHRMPLLTRFVGGDDEMTLVLRDLDAGLLDEITQARVDFAVNLIDEATDGTWPRAALERRAQVLMDTVFGVVHGGRLLRNGLPLEEYAAELADLLVDGLLSQPRGD